MPCLFIFQALANGFFNFDTFDVDEYEHYEVCTFVICEEIKQTINIGPIIK